MAKSPDAFRTISEVADWLGVEAHVVRFWETKFSQLKPVKRAGGRRYYRPSDMALLGGIRRLLHDEGMAIRGVQKILREKGAGHVAAMSPDLGLDAAEPVVPARPVRVARGSDAGNAAAKKVDPVVDDAPTLPFDLPDPMPTPAPIAAPAPPRVPARDVDARGREHAGGDSAQNLDADPAARSLPRAPRLDPLAAAEVLARARALVERLRTTPE